MSRIFLMHAARNTMIMLYLHPMPMKIANTPYAPRTFTYEVYGIVAQIPWGKVISYGEIARLLSAPGYARRVGSVLSGMSANTRLPCHRVVTGKGRTVPGWQEQRQLLESEGVRFWRNGCADMTHCRRSDRRRNSSRTNC